MRRRLPVRRRRRSVRRRRMRLHRRPSSCRRRLYSRPPRALGPRPLAPLAGILRTAHRTGGYAPSSAAEAAAKAAAAACCVPPTREVLWRWAPACWPLKTKAVGRLAALQVGGLHLMGGDGWTRVPSLETLRFCLREENRASEWYNDDAQLGASIGAACSARQACSAWPARHMKLLRIASCSTRELMQLAELDLTSAAAQGQVGAGVGGALAVLVARSKALRRLDVGGSAIGKDGAAACIALRRNRTLTSIALGHPATPSCRLAAHIDV